MQQFLNIVSVIESQLKVETKDKLPEGKLNDVLGMLSKNGGNYYLMRPEKKYEK